jgi:branched-chain amino acid transport system permease protein
LSFAPIQIGQILIPTERLLAMILALLLTAALALLLTVTRTGRAILAVRNDCEAAALMGVNVQQIFAITFGIGAAFAGAAGCLMSVVFPISPIVSSLYLGKAFVICVLGGLGSVLGALVGGLALGVIENFGALAVGPEYSVMIGFLVLLAVLTIKPSGLVGRHGFE